MTAPTIRPSLPPIPARMRGLPIDERGYPVPYFVATVDGKPDHRIADATKIRDAVRFERCYLCGGRLGGYKTFIVGPMCGITRISSDPASHWDCAVWAAAACPFLSHPRAKRREANVPTDATLSDTNLRRNPGVVLLWSTKRFGMQRDPGREGALLFRMGPPERLQFLSEGRPATREEIESSIEDGYPALLEQAVRDGDRAIDLLKGMTALFRTLLPPAGVAP